MKKNKHIAVSEYIFIENVLILFLLFPLIILSENNIYSYLFSFFLVYLTTILLFRKIYFYSEYLIILYPTRLFFRKRKIKYSNIKKIRYIHGKSAYDKPEIQIRLKNTVFFHFYLSLSTKKRKEVLRKLYKIGLDVEIKSNDWGDNRILKDIEKSKKI